MSLREIGDFSGGLNYAIAPSTISYFDGSRSCTLVRRIVLPIFARAQRPARDTPRRVRGHMRFSLPRLPLVRPWAATSNFR